MIEKEFDPPSLIAGSHVQTVLASWPPRRLLAHARAGLVRARSEDVIVDCGGDVRLLASYARATENRNGNLVVMMHGWEGSVESLYMELTAGTLLQSGFDVFRLNLRDHGRSHHLNKELFHSCRLQEVQDAVRWVQKSYQVPELSIVGFSLGGNFAMRVAAEAHKTAIQLHKVVAICPVLDPVQTMDALEYGWFGYRNYFIQKWRRSLLTKMEAFPEIYDFSSLARFRSLKEMTAYFVENHTEYPDLETYLRGYAITGKRLADLQVPSVVLLAEDDPVIPIRGLPDLVQSENLQLKISRRGGHCGFLHSYRLHSWLDGFVLDALGV